MSMLSIVKFFMPYVPIFTGIYSIQLHSFRKKNYLLLQNKLLFKDTSKIMIADDPK